MTVVDAPGLRPTPDRVRETLFNWLTHAAGGDLSGLAVLDLFAGTGALGFEAASRGATSVVLVDADSRVVAHLESSRATLGAGSVEIVQNDAAIVAARFVEAGRQFDVVLLDPPFGQGWIARALPLAERLCRPGGYIYVEAEFALAAATIAGVDIELLRADKAGEVFYHLLRRNIKER